ncbi:unnamed protein product [Rotaria sp. Silwood1]|nr:unnamed protein product [Rotaria sp. Silwood1]
MAAHNHYWASDTGYADKYAFVINSINKKVAPPSNDAFSMDLFSDSTRLISIRDLLFNQWNKTLSTIEIQHGQAMINNNYFGDNNGKAITVLQDADKVIITNNHLNENELNVVTKTNCFSCK